MNMNNAIPLMTDEMGTQSAGDTLKIIAKTYPGQLSFTFFLVILENVLLLTYPLFAGFAIDAIVRGDFLQSLTYALVVLSMWCVGAARRCVDTRTFTRIYARLAVPVILAQRSRQESHSTIAARVVLAREFVTFFELHMPMLATTIASIIGAAVMLLIVETWVGIACCLTVLLFWAILPSYSRRNEQLHGLLNDRLEKEVHLVKDSRAKTLERHYSLLAILRIRISDREAWGYLMIGTAAALLFALATGLMATKGAVTAGHVYAVMTYLWTFVTSLDDGPQLTDQFARLRDIGKRVDTGME